MLIVPIGREDAVIQRHAWVTYGIIVANVVMFILFCTGGSVSERVELIRSWRLTIHYLEDRPYLRAPWQAVALMPEDLRERTPRPDPSVSEWTAISEQRVLDAMAAELRERYDATRQVRLAYVPAAGSIGSAITSMFLHAGLLHLIGNLLFLFATAPFVEDVFGRPLFVVLYLTGGIAATLSFGARYPDSVIPLVGASGAIAAVMGAYLVRFTRSRLRFLFIPIVFLPFWNFRFALPALVVLPLWFLEQVVSIPMEGTFGVAVTAHVAGFVYGFAFALVLKMTRIEEHFIKPAIEKQISWQADPRFEAALKAFDRRDGRTARQNVTALLAEQPRNQDALRLALDVALFQEDESGADGFATRLLSCYAATDRPAAAALIEELADRKPALPQFLSAAAAHMERCGDRRSAIAFCERLVETESATERAVPALVKLAMLRRSDGDIFAARETLDRALKHPACSPEWRRKIDSTLSLIGAQ